MVAAPAGAVGAEAPRMPEVAVGVEATSRIPEVAAEVGAASLMPEVAAGVGGASRVGEVAAAAAHQTNARGSHRPP